MLSTYTMAYVRRREQGSFVPPMSNTFDILRLTLKPLGNGGYQVTYDAPILTKQKDGIWFAYSPVFKSLGYSNESEEAAIEDHDQDVQDFLGVHIRNGSLDRALSNLGWESEDNKVFEQIPNIPVELLRASQIRSSSYAVGALA